MRTLVLAVILFGACMVPAGCLPNDHDYHNAGYLTPGEYGSQAAESTKTLGRDLETARNIPTF